MFNSSFYFKNKFLIFVQDCLQVGMLSVGSHSNCLQGYKVVTEGTQVYLLE